MIQTRSRALLGYTIDMDGELDVIRKIGLVAIIIGAAVSLGGCVVAPAPGYGGRPGCRWIPAHYGAYGVFHPAHWAC
jgi:hypothetical protein